MASLLVSILCVVLSILVVFDMNTVEGLKEGTFEPRYEGERLQDQQFEIDYGVRDSLGVFETPRTLGLFRSPQGRIALGAASSPGDTVPTGSPPPPALLLPLGFDHPATWRVSYWKLRFTQEPQEALRAPHDFETSGPVSSIEVPPPSQWDERFGLRGCILRIDVTEKAPWPPTYAYYELLQKAPQEPPPPSGRGLSLRVDPKFDRASLEGSQSLWRDRVDEALGNAAAWRSWAQSNNSYRYGRSINLIVSGALAGLRATGDRAFLDRIVVPVADDMASQLRDEWSDGTVDGYIGWWWQQPVSDPNFGGRDVHPMDECLTHSCVAMIALAFETNRDLDPLYAAQADYWKGYLKDHFEMKWISRTGGRTDAWREGFYKNLWHPALNQARMAHCFYVLFEDSWYRDEREVLLSQFQADIRVHAGASSWPHRVGSWGEFGAQKMNYARYTLAALLDLVAEGVVSIDQARLLSETCKRVIEQGSSTEMALRVDLTGLTSLTPESLPAWALWSTAPQVILDATNRVWTPGSPGMYEASYAVFGSGSWD